MKYLRLIVIAFILSIQISVFSSDIFNAGQIRGLWVVRYEIITAARIDSLLKVAKKCHITDLFIQIRGRGDAFYNSHYETKSPLLKNGDFDPLNYLLSHASLDSIRIHGWLNVFYVWSEDTLPKDKNHIVNKKKHWIAQPSNNASWLSDYPRSVQSANVEGLYVSPLHPEAQKHFLNILNDILDQYPLHGIHLDYIRYPDQHFDFNPDIIKGFKNRHILNPRYFATNPELFAQKFSIAGYEVFSSYWRKFLMDGLSEFVQKIWKQIKSKHPQVLLSAAVKPDLVTAHWNYYQDWDRWLRESWLDFAAPMNYTAESELFRGRMEQYLDKLPASKYAVGISLYNQTTEQVLRKIAQIEALPRVGFILFSYRQLQDKFVIQHYLRNNYKK